MRAYHRIDPLMDERKGHYTPAQLGAFVKVQLLAGRQSNRGRFRSLAGLRNLLPAAYVRFVDHLVAEGDLVITNDGTVYVDGWDEWQEGDLTVRDRMARLRDRKRHGTVTPTVTTGVTPTVIQPSPTAIRSSVGVSVGVDGANAPIARDGFMHLTPDALEALESRTGHLASQAGDKQLNEFDRLIGAHGLGPVLAAFDRIRDGKKMTARQLVWAAVKVLEPIPDAKQADAAAREQAERDASRRRTEVTLRQTHGLGAHTKQRNSMCPLCREGDAA